MFGFGKRRDPLGPIQVTPKVGSGVGNRFADGLSIIGATLQDIDSGGETQSLAKWQANRKALVEEQQKRAQQEALMRSLAPYVGAQGQAGGAGGVPTHLLLQAAQINPAIAKTLTDLRGQDKPFYEEGVRIDSPYSPTAPSFIPKRIEGAAPTFDGGRLTGIGVIPGAAEAAATMAGAVTGAQEGNKALFDLVDVPRADGSSVKMPRIQALQSLSGVPGAGARPDGFGVTQAPRQKTYDEAAARAQVERDFTRPKAEGALRGLDAKAKVVGASIDRALSKVNNWSAGFGSMLSGVPSTDAKELAVELDTIKANLGFDELQTMRDNSPTGGALGQVAVQELEALRSTIEGLDQARSPDELRAALQRLKAYREESSARRREAFSQTYGGGATVSPGRYSRQEIEAEMRRRGLR